MCDYDKFEILSVMFATSYCVIQSLFEVVICEINGVKSELFYFFCVYLCHFCYKLLMFC